MKNWRHFEGIARRRPSRQRFFPFWERSQRLERLIKVAIFGLIVLVICGMIGGLPAVRFTAKKLAAKAMVAVKQPLGLTPDRKEIDALWKMQREHDIELSRESLRQLFPDNSLAYQKLVRFAGMAPENALIRWGNFNRVVLLPSTVFEADDTGRSYRLRPHVNSVWLRMVGGNVSDLGFFLVPNAPELYEAIKGTGALIVNGSEQSTNSWGCRGPEFDTSAPLRGIVLGDSFMQGFFVGDTETPSACLERELQHLLQTKVAILNTGHIGYSTEQYYYTLHQYMDRVKPHFVVVSVFANDAGRIEDVLEGGGDWPECGYWLQESEQLCRSHNVLCLVSPVPFIAQVMGPRNIRNYQGEVAQYVTGTSAHYCDPLEEFIDEHLKLVAEQDKNKQRRTSCLLFNSRIGDAHMSAQGCAVWARVLGRRLALLLDQLRRSKQIQF
jgi:hypothetical protein